MTVKTVRELAALIAARGIRLEDIVLDRTGCEWDYSAKSFGEMGFDALDFIEVIMDLEKALDCVIPDSLADQVQDADPSSLILSEIRSRKLDDLGI
jgi:hypothetical protein